MKTFFLSLIILLTSCGSSGGGSGGSSSPIIGSWVEHMPNPSLSIYAAISGSTFTVQQGTCTISGGYTLDANIVHASSVTRSPSCISGPSSFDCTYSMASNNQLSLSCPSFSTNLQRQ